MFWDIHGLAGLDRDISDYQAFFDRHEYSAIDGDILGWDVPKYPNLSLIIRKNPRLSEISLFFPEISSFFSEISSIFSEISSFFPEISSFFPEISSFFPEIS